MPLTTGAFAQPMVRVPVVSDGIVVGGVFIPMERKAPTGPTRDVYLPRLEERLQVLDGRAAALRTRAFESSAEDREALQRQVLEASMLLRQARDGQGSLRNVVEENFPDARDQMDALLSDATTRLDEVESRLPIE